MPHAPTSDLIYLTPEKFAIRCLGDEIALFNLNSGKTHILDSNLAAVFERLRASPKTKDTLITEAMQEGDYRHEDIETFIERALVQLRDIGLVDLPESH